MTCLQIVHFDFTFETGHFFVPLSFILSQILKLFEGVMRGQISFRTNNNKYRRKKKKAVMLVKRLGTWVESPSGLSVRKIEIEISSD